MERYEVVDRLQDDGVTINLLLTERCNFSCAHCMYECGPDKPGEYMSNEVLRAVENQMRELESNGIYPTVNIIGGEPTLNMERFGEIINEVRRWGVCIEMTTNGHWLASDELTVEFFNAVKWLQGDADEFSVRISNDEYHDCFRPSWLQGDKLKHHLDYIFEQGEPFYKSVPICPECYERLDSDEDGINCPECGEYISYVDYEYEDLIDFGVEPPDPHHPWIYVESTKYHSVSKICPQGRAASWGGGDSGSQLPGKCGGDKLSYLPDGRLMDICCMGSWCEFGTVFDDPVELAGRAMEFVQEKAPSCYECRDMAQEWASRYEVMVYAATI